MFVDTHCHLADSAFDGDREGVLRRIQEAGVGLLVEIAESPETWDAAAALADRYPFIYASLGIHPHHAHEIGDAEWAAAGRRLRELLQHPKVVAVGEFGLDYYRMRNSFEQQEFLFRKQLELAQEVNKPIVIHCREGMEARSAHADIQKALAEFYPETSLSRECPKPNGVIHCFSGTWQDAQICFQHGFMIGVDGPVTYPKSDVLKEVVNRMPLERLVLETDSPYLPPQSHRGRRNDPSHIPAVAAAVAALKSATVAHVENQTTLNAKTLYRINPAG